MNIKNTILCASALSLCASFASYGAADAARNEKSAASRVSFETGKAKDTAFTVDPSKFTQDEKTAMAAFDKKYNDARTLYNKKDYAAANTELKKLSVDKSVASFYRVKAAQLLAETYFRQGDEQAGRAVCEDALSAKEILSRDRAVLAQMLMSSYQRSKKFDQAAEAGFTRLAETALTDVEKYHTKRAVLSFLAEAGEFNAFVKLSDEFVKEKDMKVLDRLSAYNFIVDTLMRFKQFPEALRFNKALMESGEFGLAQKAGYELKEARIHQNIGDFEKADKIRLAIVEDKKLDPQTRVNAFIDYYTRLVNDRKSDKKALMTAASPIFDIPNLPGPLFSRVATQLLNNANKNLRDQKMILQLANSIYNYPEVPPADRIYALGFIVDDLINSGDFATAEKRAREPIAWKNLGNNELTNIYAKIGMNYRCQGKCDEAVSVYYELLDKVKTGDMVNRVNNLVSGEYIFFKRFADAAKVWLDAKKPMSAANVWRQGGEPEKAKAIAKSIVSDEKVSPAERREAIGYFLDDTPESKEILRVYGAAVTNNYTDNGIASQIYTTGKWAMYYGNHAHALHLLTLVRNNENFKDKFDVIFYLVRAHGALGEYDKAAKLSGEYASFENFKPLEKFRMGLENFAFTNRDENDFAKKFTAFEAKLAKELNITNKERSEMLKTIGRTIITSRLDSVGEQLEKVFDSFFVPEPKKEYTVPFSKTKISGITDFIELKRKPAPQLMDRKYGGNMEFLVTDVSTGARGAGIGSEKDKKEFKPTEMYVLSDANGLHFFFRYYDDRAREVEAKLLGAGAYEIYLAPGVNQPYTCFLPDLQSGENGIWNTTYNTEFNHRIRPNTGDVKFEQKFFDDGILSHLFVAWSVYYDKLPENGDVWEFENLHWGRSGGYGWNGTKSIHGRSTWGNLVFDLDRDDMIEAKKSIIYSALAAYNSEKRTGHNHEGVIDHWKDPAVGDIEFYNAELVPLVKKLDSYIPLVKVDMSRDDVEKVFTEAVPGWKEIKLKTDALRRAWLEKKLSE